MKYLGALTKENNSLKFKNYFVINPIIFVTCLLVSNLVSASELIYFILCNVTKKKNLYWQMKFIAKMKDEWKTGNMIFHLQFTTFIRTRHYEYNGVDFECL